MPVTQPDAETIARRLHGLIEPLHAFYYFATETREAYEGIGLKGFAQCYVAGRAAPMGAVGPGVARATFFNFHPQVMERALPSAWEIASPTAVLEARANAVERMFARIEAPTDGLAEATALAREAAAAADLAGRPLAAGNADVATPGSPYADLWQALAVLREHRGDGHVALLTSSRLHPVEVLVLHGAWQPGLDADILKRSRQWGQDEWDAAVQRLRERGWLDDDGALTEDGSAWRSRLESDTDALAAGPYEALGADASRRLFDLLTPIAQTLADSGAFPMPIRIPRPFDT